MSKVEMPYDEWLRACLNWDRFLKIKKKFCNRPTFDNGLDEFTGHDVWAVYYSDINSNKVMIDAHAVPKYRMLQSPHFKTLLKAYEIKHGPVRRLGRHLTSGAAPGV